jgi:hypothetical protein
LYASIYRQPSAQIVSFEFLLYKILINFFRCKANFALKFNLSEAQAAARKNYKREKNDTTATL